MDLPGLPGWFRPYPTIRDLLVQDTYRTKTGQGAPPQAFRAPAGTNPVDANVSARMQGAEKRTSKEHLSMQLRLD